MAKTSKPGRSTETGPFKTGQQGILKPRREDKTDKKLGRMGEE